MFLKEIAEKIDKSASNEAEKEYESFCSALNLEKYCYDYAIEAKFEEKMTSYWISSWMCTDQWVGKVLYFFEDQLVAYSEQYGRKSDLSIYFVNNETAQKLRDFIIKASGKPEYTFSLIDLEEKQLEECYALSFAGQIIPSLHSHGSYNGLKCKYLSAKSNNVIENEINVEFPDGTQLTINVADYYIEYHTK